MKLFKLAEKQSSVKNEILAGFGSFIAMAYTFILGPQLLSQTGMDFNAVYSAMLIVAALATLAIGLLANYPYALTPNIALAAFFTYGAVGSAGLSWQIALGICFCAGIMTLLLNLFKLRERTVQTIPAPLRYATAGGIGLFLITIALKSIGLITAHESTFLAIGKFSKVDLGVTALGVLVSAALLSRRVKGAYLIGLIIIWLIGLFLGMATWNGFFAQPTPLSPTLLQLDIKSALTVRCLPLILSFALVILFDTAATLLGISEQARLLEGKGTLLRPDGGLYAEPVGTIAGACLGTSPVTPTLEAATGIAVGGRSGLTSLLIAIFCLGALFLAPFAQGIPPFATAPIFIIAGAGLLQQLKKINWHEATDAIPALLILLAIPLTSNIATGISLGFIAYPVFKVVSGRIKEVSWLVWVLAIILGISYYYA